MEEEAAVAVGVLVVCVWRSAQRSAVTTGGPGQLVVRRGHNKQLGEKYLQAVAQTVKDWLCKRSGVL